MWLPSDPESTTLRDETSELLFDAYLDQALAGELEDPIVFCDRHDITTGGVRERIVAFHRAAGGGSSQSSAESLPAEPGMPFEQLGEFRLIRELGSVGMGMSCAPLRLLLRAVVFARGLDQGLGSGGGIRSTGEGLPALYPFSAP
jgi:hypothetical protein